MRCEVEQRLLRRHPDLPAGVVVAAVGRAARQLTAAGGWLLKTPWGEVEHAAEEQLLLRRTLRLQGRAFGPADEDAGDQAGDPTAGSAEAG